MSGGANACSICQALEIMGLKQQLQEAQAKCAEMRERVSEVWDACCEIGGRGLDTIDADKFLHALSSDYGKGWRSPEQFAEAIQPTIELLKEVTHHFCGTHLARQEAEIARLESLVKGSK